MGKAFLVGYFLPTLLFVGATCVLFPIGGILPQEASLAVEFVAFSGALAIFALPLSVIVMLLNFALVQLYEGYSFEGLGIWFGKVTRKPWITAVVEHRKKRHAHTVRSWTKEKAALRSRRSALQAIEENHALAMIEEQELEAVCARLATVSHDLAHKFPSEEHLLLPTKFGNVVRSFEDYPRVMYGADAVATWTRLIAVIPVDYRQILDEEKAKMDFFLNVSALAPVFGVLSFAVGLASDLTFLTGLILPIAGIVVFWVAYRMAISAALSWGNCVKAAFDVFLGDLEQKIHLPTTSSPNIHLPTTSSPKTRRTAWLAFNQATLYRDQKALEDSTQPNPERR